MVMLQAVGVGTVFYDGDRALQSEVGLSLLCFSNCLLCF